MARSDDLDCRLFVDTELLPEAIGRVIVDTLPNSTLETKVYTPIVHTRYLDIEIRENEYFDEQQRKQVPDGFMSFRYSLELYAVLNQSMEKRIAQVAHILEVFWSRRIPAVAACDYEDELPYKGGAALSW